MAKKDKKTKKLRYFIKEKCAGDLRNKVYCFRRHG